MKDRKIYYHLTQVLHHREIGLKIIPNFKNFLEKPLSYKIRTTNSYNMNQRQKPPTHGGLSKSSKFLVFFVLAFTLLPRPAHSFEDLLRVQKYLGRKCSMFADILEETCAVGGTLPCCTLFSLVDICRTSCAGDFSSMTSKTLNDLLDHRDFCPQITNAGKQLCGSSQSKRCQALKCFMNLACFSGTTCDVDDATGNNSPPPTTQGPNVAFSHTRHQTRRFEFPELSACESTNLVGIDPSDVQVCPPARVTSICGDTDLKYRSIDGTCNNLNYPDWGKTFGTPKRYLPPRYQDGHGAPRTLGVDGKPLKSPRYISRYVSPERNTKDYLSVMMASFGQYIDHDFTGFPVIKLNSTETKCCGNSTDPSLMVENGGPCFPIYIDSKDDFFKDRECMEFIRSSAAVDENDNFLDPREQINGLTSVIDASSVYGSTADVNHMLRGPGGRLVTGRNNMLPDLNKTNCKIDDNSTDYCLFTGDHRVNVFVGLGVLHTIFHRLHNQLVEQLTQINPHWDDDRLYQEARKINAALHQHFTYNEYVPAILNDEYLIKYRLRVGEYVYDPTLNPSMANVFSTAAFRFGHSQIPDFVLVGADKFSTESTLMRPHLVLTRFDEVTKGLVRQSSEMVDRFFSESVTDRMFEANRTRKDGLDLVAFNIQRGRDHGLPPYNEFRKFCNLAPITDFNSPELWPDNELGYVYRNVDDVDVFAGMVSERFVPGCIVGPTFACILAQQFHDLKFGDRFFYETPSQREGFTPEQLLEIKSMKLSDVICSTTNIPTLQPFVMLVPEATKNPITSCTLRKEINIAFWKEQP